MPHRTFISFIWPSALAMILFIALPIVSVAVQSLYIQHEQVIETVKNCGPFGCTESVVVNVEATEKIRAEQPLGRFNGLGTYTNRNHLAFAEIGEAWHDSSNWTVFFAALGNLPFYKALFFTLAYTLVVTPLVLLLGFFIALAVNRLLQSIRGRLSFFVAADDCDPADRFLDFILDD